MKKIDIYLKILDMLLSRGCKQWSGSVRPRGVAEAESEHRERAERPLHHGQAGRRVRGQERQRQVRGVRRGSHQRDRRHRGVQLHAGAGGGLRVAPRGRQLDGDDRGAARRHRGHGHRGHEGGLQILLSSIMRGTFATWIF